MSVGRGQDVETAMLSFSNDVVGNVLTESMRAAQDREILGVHSSWDVPGGDTEVGWDYQLGFRAEFVGPVHNIGDTDSEDSTGVIEFIRWFHAGAAGAGLAGDNAYVEFDTGDLIWRAGEELTGISEMTTGGSIRATSLVYYRPL